MSDLVIRDARLVPLPGTWAAPEAAPDATTDLVDLHLSAGRIVGIRPSDQRDQHDAIQRGDVIEADGRWAMPGLWDQHVHLGQWGLASVRLDTSPATDVASAARLVAERLASAPLPASGVLTGWGHRSAGWSQPLTVEALDAVAPDAPVVLMSGDGHHGWLNSAAFRLLGMAPRDEVVAEAEWFALFARISDLPGTYAETETGVADAVATARGRGVVGIVDLEFTPTWDRWPSRYAAGAGPIRIRTGAYPEFLDDVVERGWSSGTPLPGCDGLATMGPLKVITDGSLNTRTAWCCEPFADNPGYRGAPNVPVDQVLGLLAHAHAHGLEAALHAIGDAAVDAALSAYEQTGASGAIEHAQLVRLSDLPRWGRLPVRASVQPSHLLDDRGVTEQCWPDRTDRTFALRSMLDAGITLAMGSDAPVSPLDPWLSMAAAVHRGPTDRPSWHPEQEISALEALAASVDGQALTEGGVADVVLLDADPLAGATSAEQARALGAMPVALTVVAGEVGYRNGSFG